MNNNNIECICGIEFEKRIFKNHFKNCKLLLSKFLNFDKQISLLIKEYIYNKQSLIIIRFLFKRYIKLFDQKLKKLANQNNNNIDAFKMENIEKPVKNKNDKNCKKYFLNENIKKIFSGNEPKNNSLLEKDELNSDFILEELSKITPLSKKITKLGLNQGNNNNNYFNNTIDNNLNQNKNNNINNLNNNEKNNINNDNYNEKNNINDNNNDNDNSKEVNEEIDYFMEFKNNYFDSTLNTKDEWNKD